MIYYTITKFSWLHSSRALLKNKGTRYSDRNIIFRKIKIITDKPRFWWHDNYIEVKYSKPGKKENYHHPERKMVKFVLPQRSGTSRDFGDMVQLKHEVSDKKKQNFFSRLDDPLQKNEVIMEIGNLDNIPLGSETKKNYNRNKKLIDLSQIPLTIQENIINTFIEQPIAPRMKVLNYLIKKRYNQLIEVVEEFYNGETVNLRSS